MFPIHEKTRNRRYRPSQFRVTWNFQLATNFQLLKFLQIFYIIFGCGPSSKKQSASFIGQRKSCFCLWQQLVRSKAPDARQVIEVDKINERRFRYRRVRFADHETARLVMGEGEATVCAGMKLSFLRSVFFSVVRTRTQKSGLARSPLPRVKGASGGVFKLAWKVLWLCRRKRLSAQHSEQVKQNDKIMRLKPTATLSGKTAITSSSKNLNCLPCKREGTVY